MAPTETMAESMQEKEVVSSRPAAKTSAKLWLLQGQMQAAAGALTTSAPVEAPDAQDFLSRLQKIPACAEGDVGLLLKAGKSSSTRLAAYVAAALGKEGDAENPDDPWALLRQVRSLQQSGEDADEELGLALHALELLRAGSDRTGELAALCAVVDAHLGVENLREALDAATEALLLARKLRKGSEGTADAEAAGMAALVKVHVMGLREESEALEAGRELLVLLRELSATWSELAAMLSVAEWRLSNSSAQDALEASSERMNAAREADSRFAVAAELCVTLRAHLAVAEPSSGEEALKGVWTDFVRFSREEAFTWREASILLAAAEVAPPANTAEEANQQAQASLEAARGSGDDRQEGAALLLVAAALAETEAFEEAEARARQALDLFEGIGLREGVAATWNTVAELQLAQGKLSGAKLACIAALQLFRDLKHSKGERMALVHLGQTLLDLDQPEDALRAGLDALDACHATADRRGEACALQVIVRACVAARRHVEEALRLGSEAGRLFCDVEERRDLADLLSVMSQVHMGLHAPDAAASAANDAVAAFREFGGRGTGLATALCCLARAQLATGVPGSPMQAAEEGLELLGKSSAGGEARQELGAALRLLLLKGHMAKGDTAMTLKRGEAALEQLRSVEPLAGDASDTAKQRRLAREADVLHVLAEAHLAEKDPQRAAQLANEALQAHKELGDRASEKAMVQALVSAELLVREQQIGQEVADKESAPKAKDAVASGPSVSAAIKAASKAADEAVVERFRKDDDKTNEAIALQTVAKTHIAKKEFFRAAREAKNAQRIFKSLGDTEGEVAMLKTAVEAHLSRPEKEGKDDALQTVLDALEGFRETENIWGEAMALHELAVVYVLKGEPEAAVNVVQDAMALFREVGDKRREMAVMHAIVNSNLIKEGMESSDDALRAVKSALAICNQADYRTGEACMLLTTFRLLRARGKPERALQAAEEALKIFKELGDKGGEAEVLHLTAKALLEREEHKKALTMAQKAMSLFKEAGDRTAESAALQTVLAIQISRGEHSSAMEVSKDALALCREQGDKQGEAATLHQLCKAHLASGGREAGEKAASTAREALTLFQEAGDLPGEASALLTLAKTRALAGEHADAEKRAKEAGRVASRCGDRAAQATALQLLGDAALARGRAFEALEAAEEALELFRELQGKEEEEAVALTTVINARLANAEPSEALRTAKAAHERARRLASSKGEAAALQAVASVCIHIRAPTEAVQALTNAQTICRKLKDRKREAGALAMSINAHLLTGDVSEALRAAKEARGICQEIKDRRGEAEVLEIVTQVHVAQGETNDALDAARGMATLLEQLGEESSLAQARQMMAELYAAKGDFDGAVKSAKEALEQSKKLAGSDPTVEAAALQMVAQAHMMRHQNASEKLQEEGDWVHLPQEDPREAMQAATKARNIFKQAGDSAKEAEVLQTLAQVHVARNNLREATRCAEDQLFLARKTKDQMAEGNAQLLCAAMYAEQDRLAPATRAATAAKEIFQELGQEEGLQNADWYLEWFQQVAAQWAEQERQQQQQRRGGRGVQPFGATGDTRVVIDACGRPVREREPQTQRRQQQRDPRMMGGSNREVSSSQLYNRKAFPWTPQQKDIPAEGADGASQQRR